MGVPRNLRGLSQRHGGRCCTIFSASNYMGVSGNRGGVLQCEGVPLKFECKEHWAPPWQTLAHICSIQESKDKMQAISNYEAQFDIKTPGFPPPRRLPSGEFEPAVRA